MICYNKCNVSKKELLEGAFEFYPDAFTGSELADKTGMNKITVASLLSYYNKHHYGYFRRLKVKDGRRYRYTLTKKGARALFRYRLRMARGFDLNCRKRVPVRVDSYVYEVPTEVV